MIDFKIKLKINYDDPVQMGNLAEELDDQQRQKLGSYLKGLVDADIESRRDWVDSNNDWLKLAAQVKEEKTFPWPDASNVKYPLLAVACTQFQSRSMPALMPDNNPVKVGVVGKDQTQAKQERADRISSHMSWQVTEKMENWIDDFDRLLYVLPISGMAHKKLYYNGVIGSPASRLVLPQDMIIDFNATNLDTARRTERLFLSHNEVKSLENAELIIPVVSTPQKTDAMTDSEKEEILLQKDNGKVEDLPYLLYEIHCDLDLDQDGYQEPYMVTINSTDGQLLRIKPRWEEGEVTRNETNNKITDIKRIKYYADYMFMPHPLSATHALGFGHLIGPLNEAVNTNINQLVDAGTLANMQGGFLARGVKLKGKMRFKPGEWKQVNINPADLKNGILPMPVKDPSSVLFQLLGMLIDAAERISSVTDAMVGENPGQNTPTSNMQAMLEQGQKVFSGIFTRVYRGLGREFKLLYHINRVYHDPEGEIVMLDDGSTVETVMADYEDESMDIRVSADPKMITDAMLLLKAQGLMDLVQMGTVNPQYATREYMKAQHYTKEEIQEAMNVPDPGPSPEEMQLQLEGAKFEHQKQMDGFEMQLDLIRIQSEARKDIAQSIKAIADADATNAGIEIDKMTLMLDAMTQETNMQADNLLKAMQAAKTAAEADQVGKGEVNETTSGGQAQ